MSVKYPDVRLAVVLEAADWETVQEALWLAQCVTKAVDMGHSAVDYEVLNGEIYNVLENAGVLA